MKIIYDLDDPKDQIAAVDVLESIEPEAWNVLQQLGERHTKVSVETLKAGDGATLAEVLAHAQGRAQGVRLLFADIVNLRDRAAKARADQQAASITADVRRPALVASPGHGRLS